MGSVWGWSSPRIIPAFAGSTFPPDDGSIMTRDHPRIRGEHIKAAATVDRVMGSSPHSRGALALRDQAVVADGIIPAFAGSTL